MKLLAFAIGISMNAVILRMTVRWAAKFTLPWGDAIGVAFLSGIAGVLVDLIMPMVGLSVLTNIVVVAGIYGALIQDPETGPIGFGKGMLVLIYEFSLFAVIAAAVIVVYVLILKGSI
jgi:hypothetical protein